MRGRRAPQRSVRSFAPALEVGLLGPAAVWLYQSYLWLRSGDWTPLPLIKVMPDSWLYWLESAVEGWGGVEKIVVWLVSVNLGIWLLALLPVGFCIGTLGNWMQSHAIKEAKAAETARRELGYDE